MPTFDELKQRYMVTATAGGSLSPGDPGLPIDTGCHITPHFPGPAYFQALKREIERPGVQFIYLAKWWLDPSFSLDGASGTPLVNLLKQKSQAGVDVRVLGWVMAPEVLQSSMVQSSPQAASLLRLNGETMQFINQLRAEPTMAHKAALNILAHPAGAVHNKVAIVGSESQAVAFTGGLDPQTGRHEAMWHDVQAQVTGPVVNRIYNAYRDMWNEVRGRSPVNLVAGTVRCASHTASMPALGARSLSGAGGRMHVHSVRTLPQFRFASLGLGGSLAGVSLPTNRPLSYAPSGLFEIKRAWQKGIGGAQQYVYIEDQGFLSGEVFDWINARVKAQPELRAIVVTGLVDPNDDLNNAMAKYFANAVNNHLVKGLNASQLARVGLFSHKTKVIHTKSTIVDDQWAIIGSANSMRRSLYTDFEHSVAYMDEEGRAIPAYRRDLWAVHLGTGHAAAADGITAWFAIPFRGAGAAGSAQLERIRLPMPSVTLTADEQAFLNEIYDCDSREDWGDDLKAMYMRSHGVPSIVP